MTEEAQTTEGTAETLDTGAETVKAVLDTPEIKAAEETSDTGWRDAISEDLRGLASIQGFKSVDELVKSFDHTKSLVGKKVTDMSKEELQKINAALGVPENRDGYNLGDEFKDSEWAGWYKEAALKSGLSKQGAEALAKEYAQYEADYVQQQQLAFDRQNEEWADSLKKEFGDAFEERVGWAQRAIDEFGGDELRKALVDAGLGNHPAVVKAFVNAGKQFAESKFVDGKSVNTRMTPHEARERVTTLKSDPDFMKHYNNPMSPRHKEVRQQINDLYKLQVPQ